MSNESWPSSGSPVPPPPPGAPTPPPPPPFGSAPPPPGAPPAPGYPAPPAWNEAAAKPPRPAAPLGAGLMIAGAVLLVVGSVLTWFTFGDLDVNGFTELPNASDEEQVRDGPVFVFFAVVLAAFGIATLAARRNLAVAILAVITGALAVLAALVDLTDVLDLEDDPFLGDAIDVGPGLPVVMLGALVGLAGSIVVLAKRRR